MYGITTAETSHTQEITRRQKQYILTMLVRVVSIIVVVSVPGISWPLKIGLCVVATIIPYVAVVRANGGPSREKDPTNLMLGPRQGELGAAQRGLPGPGERQDFIVGEWVPRDPSQPQGEAAAHVSREPTMDDSTAGDRSVRDAGAWAAAARGSAAQGSTVDETVTQRQEPDAGSGDTAFEPEPGRLQHGAGL